MTAGAPTCVIGACNVDLTGRSAAPLRAGDSSPGRISTAWGGVARNVAENLARLGLEVSLFSALGNDGFAASLRSALAASGVGLTALTWFLDPVSTTKATRVIPHLGRLDTVTPNLPEAQALTGITGNTPDAVSAMGDALLEAGVGNVFISLAGDGLFYADGIERGFVRAPVEDIISVNGAGDAQVAGLIHARTRGVGIAEAACRGLALGGMTLGCEPAVDPALTEHRLSTYHEQIVIERY